MSLSHDCLHIVSFTTDTYAYTLLHEMANRDMVKWQSNVLSHLDDDDSDSDKESALSGSFMVDSVMWVSDIAITICDSLMW